MDEDLRHEESMNDTENARRERLHEAAGDFVCEECDDWVRPDHEYYYKERTLCFTCYRDAVMLDFGEILTEVKGAFGDRADRLAVDLMLIMQDAHFKAHDKPNAKAPRMGLVDIMALREASA
jgi:hypothetical protein